MPYTPYYGASLYGAKSSYSTLIASTSSGNSKKESNSSRNVGGTTFLTGNTAALSKTFTGYCSSDALKPQERKRSPTRKYLGTSSSRSFQLSTDDSDQDYKRPTKYEVGTYTSRYANYIQSKKNESQQNKTKQFKSKENPTKSVSRSGQISRQDDDCGSICRNRHVVRFTIKKEQAPLTSVVYNNPVKSIAQKLLEKYTIHDKKADPFPYVPKNKYIATNSLPPTEVSTVMNDKTHRSPDTNPILPSTSSTVNTKTTLSDSQIKTDTGHDGDDEMSDNEEEGTGFTKHFVKSNRPPLINNKIQNPEEFKEAMVAAILHPGIDIESDDEFRKLINEESDGSKRSSKRKSKEKKKEVVTNRKKSKTNVDGEIIVDKLKHYVKQQLTLKKESLKSKINTTKIKKDNKKELIYTNSVEKLNMKERVIPNDLQDGVNIKQIETYSTSKRDDQDSKSKVISNNDHKNTLFSTSSRLQDGIETANLSFEGQSYVKDSSPLYTANGCSGNKVSHILSNNEPRTVSKNNINKVTNIDSSSLELKNTKWSDIGVKNDETRKHIAATNNSSKNKFEVSDPVKSDIIIKKSDFEKRNHETNKWNKDNSISKNYSNIFEKKPTESLANKMFHSSKKKSIEKVTNSKKNTGDISDSQHEYMLATNSQSESFVGCKFDDNMVESKYKSSFDVPLQSDSSIFSNKTKLGVNDEHFQLRKSATSQITPSKDEYGFKTKIFNDTKAISFENSSDMKPSLLQFLEDSKSDMNAIAAEKDKSEITATKAEDKLFSTNIDSSVKKVLKRPRLVNVEKTNEEKTTLINDINCRKILKRPVILVKQEHRVIKQTIQKVENLKPIKVWKKPTASETEAQMNKCNELKNVLGGLKSQKLKAVAIASSTTKLSKKAAKDNSKKEVNPSISPSVTVTKDTSRRTNNKVPVNSSLSVDKKSSEKNEKKVESDVVNEGFPGGIGVKKSETSNSTLSTCLSADSAYGSSPSTPQPRSNDILEKSQIEEKVPDKKKLSSKKIEEICTLCSTNCHKKCEKQMPNLCGVNQKLLAEALSSVKKGSSSPDGRDAFRTLNVATTSKSSPSISSSEAETTTTDDDETDTDSSEFNGPAEIRSPIQTRPKFKKYNLDDFNFIKVLGKGSFGKVMLAQQVNTENYFAVKCLKKDVVLEDNDVECCLIERKVLTLGTKHPYLCHLFCSFQTPSHLFFVMEYLTGGDLMFHIQHVGRFDEYRACFYGAEIISGLKFLHNKGIIYRDLKLDNMLLDYQGHIRIADFGMCKLQIYLDRFADTFCGTPDYMAPEVIKGQHYNQCVDWWSFGVLLYEMMVGKSPFKGCDEDHLFWLICNEEPFYPRFLSREAQSILKQLLDKDSSKRLGPPYNFYGEIKCHSFFKYIDWNKIERKEVETPYKPRLRHILDVQYFDRLFTKRNAALTPLDSSILESMDQTPFKEFSYTNPNITD